MSTVEFRAHCEAWTERKRVESQRAISLAWHIAVFASKAMLGGKEDPLKPLYEYLGEPAPRKTLAEQKAELNAFAEVWGLKVRPANTKIKVVYPKGHPKAGKAA